MSDKRVPMTKSGFCAYGPGASHEFCTLKTCPCRETGEGIKHNIYHGMPEEAGDNEENRQGSEEGGSGGPTEEVRKLVSRRKARTDKDS